MQIVQSVSGNFSFYQKVSVKTRPYKVLKIYKLLLGVILDFSSSLQDAAT